MKFPSRTAVYRAMIPRRSSPVNCLGSGSEVMSSSIMLLRVFWIDMSAERDCDCGGMTNVVFIIYLSSWLRFGPEVRNWLWLSLSAVGEEEDRDVMSWGSVGGTLLPGRVRSSASGFY